MARKQMLYSELTARVVVYKLKNIAEVVSWLIGYQKVVTESDWDNIMRLYHDNFIDY